MKINLVKDTIAAIRLSIVYASRGRIWLTFEGSLVGLCLAALFLRESIACSFYCSNYKTYLTEINLPGAELLFVLSDLCFFFFLSLKLLMIGSFLLWAAIDEYLRVLYIVLFWVLLMPFTASFGI